MKKFGYVEPASYFPKTNKTRTTKKSSNKKPAKKSK